MGKLREWYIRVFEVPWSVVPPWVILLAAFLVGFFSAWWMQEQGWP